MDGMSPMPAGYYDPPRQPWETRTEPERSADPLAVAVGNASLLGVGYLLLRRPLLAGANWLVTLVLLGLLIAVDHHGWVQLAGLVVWVAVIGHGSYLAIRHDRQVPADRPRRPWPQRLVALAATVAVVVGLGALRVDATRIERTATAAHRADDCQTAQTTLDRLWAAHRIVAAAVVNREPDSRAACQLLLLAESQAQQGDRLRAADTLETYRRQPAAVWPGAADRRSDLLLAQAAADLDTALTGDTSALDTGFEHLSTVLADSPGRSDDVATALDRFAAKLPADDPCDTMTITDWLADRPSSGDERDRAAAVVPEIAPAAIVGCADHFSGTKPDRARELYRQLLDQYPDDKLVPKAKHGERRATLAIQLIDVRRLLGTTGENGLPSYCADPARYEAAAPYRGRNRGPYRTLTYGNDGHRKQFPTSWRAKGATDAVLVMCAGEQSYGSVVDTCYYTSDTALNPIGGFAVKFHKRKVPVRVYELRTGKLVAKRTLQIDGRSCPRRLDYSYYGPLDLGPDPDVYVTSSGSNVRAAYRSVIDP